MSEKQVPMIPKHQAEKDAMHMTFAMKCIVIVSVSFAIAMVLAIIIFVNGYTSRTKDWLATISQLQGRPTITEVANEKEETGTVQQLPIP